tara:strand:- start:627 stop:803 length:177 start_codon:yes stop_codon:yes gene_type:complete
MNAGKKSQQLLDKMGNRRFLIAAKDEKLRAQRLAKSGILTLHTDEEGRMWAKRTKENS